MPKIIKHMARCSGKKIIIGSESSNVAWRSGSNQRQWRGSGRKSAAQAA